MSILISFPWYIIEPWKVEGVASTIFCPRGSRDNSENKHRHLYGQDNERLTNSRPIFRAHTPFDWALGTRTNLYIHESLITYTHTHLHTRTHHTHTPIYPHTHTHGWMGHLHVVHPVIDLEKYLYTHTYINIYALYMYTFTYRLVTIQHEVGIS